MAGMIEYKCPCCGGKVEFNSGLQQMKCPFCDSVFDVEAMSEYDNAINTDTTDDMQWDSKAGQDWQPGETDNMRIYTCQSCGGEIVADENVGATHCPYCDNPVVMTGQFTGSLKPDYVIPFKLDRDAAKAAYNNHLKGKKLLPKLFKDQNHIDEIKGIYVPFWLFGAGVNADISYNATKVHHWSDSNYRYTKTDYFHCKRVGDLAFDKVPVDGSSKMEDSLMESIEPFNFGEAVDFQTAYLSGYLADKYDVTSEESITRANDRIRNSTDMMFRNTVDGYATVTTASTNIKLFNSKAKYALYPVWLLNTTWNGEHYYFAMNGQTGKFVGDLPCDKGAFWKWWAILSGVFGIAVYGVLMLLHII